MKTEDKMAKCVCSSQSEGRWRRRSFRLTVLSVLLLVGPVSSAPAQAGTPLSGDSGGNVGCIPCDGQARYIGPGKSGVALGLGYDNAGVLAAQVVQETGGWLRNLQVTTDPGNDGGNWNISVWVNGRPSGYDPDAEPDPPSPPANGWYGDGWLGCTVNSVNHVCENVVDSVRICAGDAIAILIGNPGYPFTYGNFKLFWTMDLEPTTEPCPSPIADTDGDGVPDNLDQCLSTPLGAVVDANGCAINDLCPCDHKWRNHGAFVSCVARTANSFIATGLITEAQKDAIVSKAGASTCGKTKK